MTKEQLKYYIDNLDNFEAELIQKIQAIPQERLEILQKLDMNSAQDFERYYEICSEFCKDILEKYHMNLEIFKTVFSIQNDNGKEIIGREKYTQLLKDIIDIYEDQANDILGTNNDEYDISSLDGIIVGENNDKYIEFYKVVALNRCKEKLNLSELGKTFLSIHPKIISEEFLTETLSNIQDVKGNDIYNFIENAPIKVLNANTMKIILSKIERIEDFNLNKILPMIQTEMYDRDVATQLLEKVNERSISTVFRSIPSEIKDIEMYEYAISKAKDIAYELPEEKIEGMNDDEYRKWCEDQIIGTLKGETDQNYVMAKLPEHLITERICTELIRKMPDNKKYMLSELFKKIPENYKSRTLYEELIKKSPELIEEIPEETFEEGLTQKEYDKWVEEAILKVVSESTELERIISYIPRIRYSEKVWNSLMDRAIELGQRKVSIKNVPIQNRTINMYERALKEDEMSMKYIPSIDRNLDEVRSDNLKKEYKSWISGLTEEQKQEYRNWYEEKVIDYIIDKDANLFDGNY